MSAYMPHPMQPHDPELDRALALARTPQVPESLAARIARDVPRLPQEPLPIRAVETPAVPPRKARGWLRVAGFAALTLLTGAAAATFLLQNGSDGDQPAQQLAAIDRSSVAVPTPSHTAPKPASQGAALARPAAPAGSDTPPALKPIAPPSKSPAAQQAPVELASETAPPAPVASKSATTVAKSLAENGPVDMPEPTGTLAPPTSVYGPPAGLGISNGGGMAMPENAGQSTMPRGGVPSGMPGGGMPGGGMGGPGGGPGGGMHPRH